MAHEKTVVSDEHAEDENQRRPVPRRSSGWQRLTAAMLRFPQGRGRWVLAAVLAATVAVGVYAWTADSDDTTILTVRLSDVDAMLDTDEIDRVGINESAGVVQLWVDGEEAERLAVASAERYAADNDLEAPELDEVADRGEEMLAASASFPPGYAGELTADLLGTDVTVGATDLVPPREWPLALARVMPLLLIVLVLAWYVRSSGNIGRGRKVTAVEEVDTTFADVAGVDEAVDELSEIVAYLHDPRRFVAAGARPPAGVLLEGPPGTGKTLLARAVAGEAGVPFFAVSGSDFVETFIGVGARRVRDLFAMARKAGQAVVFIDEIDAIGRARGAEGAQQGSDERESTLNALLVAMGGFEESQVIVLAATNRADMLDSALTRPGRFDRRVVVPAPDRAGREAILRVHARDKEIADHVDFSAISRRTSGMTGAELENLINVAALEAARSRRVVVSDEDMEQALQTVALGRARTSAVVSDEDRRITAWHEAGHTIAALMQDAADDPVTVTVIPRGPSGGTTWMAGDDRQFVTRTKAQAQLTVALAGRAAEEILLDGDYTQGASGDLSSATDLAARMVTSYGMSGSLSVYSAERYQAGGSAHDLDEAIEALLQEALANARALLATHEDELRTLVGWLLEDDTVAADRLRTLRADDADDVAERELQAIASGDVDRT